MADPEPYVLEALWLGRIPVRSFIQGSKDLELSLYNEQLVCHVHGSEDAASCKAAPIAMFVSGPGGHFSKHLA